MHRPAAVAVLIVLAGCGIGAPVVQPAPAQVRPPDDGGPIPAAQDPEAEVMNQLVDYAAQHPDTFGGMWIDPPGGATVVMAFTADLDTHLAAVNAILPGTRVVGVTHPKAVLDDLQALLSQGLPADGEYEPISVGVDERRNVVVFELKTNDPTLELRLEATHSGMLDVVAHPIPGPWANVEAGEGWRLLVARDGLGADAYTVRAATTAADWSQLAQQLGIEPGQPHPDLETEVVVAFFHGIGSSCPEMRLDGVEIGDGVVFSRVSDPLSPRACTADLVGSAVFVVALERDALPADGFTLRLTEDGIGEPIEVSLP